MKVLKKVVISSFVLLLIGANVSNINASSSTLSSTNYWRICSTSWTKSEFNLRASDPNVSVTASWSYNYDTGVQNYVWNVSNASKSILRTNGEYAVPTVNITGIGLRSADWKRGKCSYVYLPVGSQPFSLVPKQEL